jgi:hypothetical protein
MTTLKGFFLGLIISTLISCTQESANAILPPQQIQSDSSDFSSTAAQNTEFGILVAHSTVSETQEQMIRTGIKLVRAQVIFSKETSSKTVDQYLKNGFQVMINYNWKETNVTVPFPTDAKFINDQAEAFFKYYAPYKSQIPAVVVENEWDNMRYHSGDIQDYLQELEIITNIGHKYGFKIAGAGITSKGINLWMSSRTTGDAALIWKKMAGATSDSGYSAYVNRVNAYITGVKRINVDFMNVHWYNEKECSNNFGKASGAYADACGKTAVICNEFGIRTNSAALFSQTVNEIRNNAAFAVAYSGVNDPGKAVTLTDEMLASLND